jgi:hypothetical protein
MGVASMTKFVEATTSMIHFIEVVTSVAYLIEVITSIKVVTSIRHIHAKDKERSNR